MKKTFLAILLSAVAVSASAQVHMTLDGTTRIKPGFFATLGTGTPSSTTYLRGDGIWATPAVGSGGAIGNGLSLGVNLDAGLFRTAPGTLALGNGTAGDDGGTLDLTALNARGNLSVRGFASFPHASGAINAVDVTNEVDANLWFGISAAGASDKLATIAPATSTSLVIGSGGLTNALRFNPNGNATFMGNLTASGTFQLGGLTVTAPDTAGATVALSYSGVNGITLTTNGVGALQFTFPSGSSVDGGGAYIGDGSKLSNLVTAINGQSGALTQIVQSVDTITALRSLPIPAATGSVPVQVLGYYAAGDKNPVNYRWVASSTAPEDGGAAIIPTGHSGAGRWLLMWDHRTANAADWGLQGQGADDTTHIQAAVDAIAANGLGVVNFPVGQFNTTGIVLGALNGTTGHESDSTFISLHGVNEGSTQFKYTGPANGVLLKFNRNIYANFDHLRLTGSSAGPGTTEGIQMGGPSFGNASQNNVFNHIIIEGFHIGWHLSSNAYGVRSGTSSSECSMKDSTITDCDNGVYNDDFNSLNHVIVNVDFQRCKYGVYLVLPGINILSSSGEYNGVDIFYDNATQNTGVVPIANWRSEHAGCCVLANGRVSLDNVLVVAPLTTGPTYPTDLAGFTIPANFLQYPSIMLLYGAGGATIRNCNFQYPVYFAAPVDIDVEHCMVASTDLIAPRQDNPSANGARYRIAFCMTSTDLQENQAKYPDRTGTVVGTTMVDSVTTQANGSSTYNAHSIAATDFDFSNLPTSVAGLAQGHAYLNSGSFAVVPPPGAALATSLQDDSPTYCLILDRNYYNAATRILSDAISGATWTNSNSDLLRLVKADQYGKDALESQGNVPGNSPALLVSSGMGRLAQYVVAMRSHAGATLWQGGYGAPMGGATYSNARNFLLPNTTTFHGAFAPTAVRKNGVALTAPYDLAPISDWMIVAVTIDPSLNTADSNMEILGSGGVPVAIDEAVVVGWATPQSAATIHDVEQKLGNYLNTVVAP